MDKTLNFVPAILPLKAHSGSLGRIMAVPTTSNLCALLLDHQSPWAFECKNYSFLLPHLKETGWNRAVSVDARLLSLLLHVYV